MAICAISHRCDLRTQRYARDILLSDLSFLKHRRHLLMRIAASRVAVSSSYSITCSITGRLRSPLDDEGRLELIARESRLSSVPCVPLLVESSSLLSGVRSLPGYKDRNLEEDSISTLRCLRCLDGLDPSAVVASTASPVVPIAVWLLLSEP